MDALLRNWSIGKISKTKAIPSYWGKTSLIKTMNGKFFILKEKSDISITKKESNLLVHLLKAGAPVAVPIRTLKSEWYVIDEGKIFCLYPKLPGENITEHYAGNATSRAEKFGKAIGQLHTWFSKCDGIPGYSELKLLEIIQEWALPCIRKHKGVVSEEAIEAAWSGVEMDLNKHYHELPKHLIHRDPNPANMLFDKGKLTGFIDFEMVERGPRIFDLCYCGTSLLVGAYPDYKKMQTWPDLYHAIVKGYQEFISLTSIELKSLYGTLVTIELLFAAFSLESGNEGAAKCNASVLFWLKENRDRIKA